MHDNRSIILARLNRVLRERIAPARFGDRRPLAVTAWEVPGEPVDASQVPAAGFVPFEVGSTWGRPWGTTWFRCTGEVPSDWAGQVIAARIDLGFSAMTGFQCEGLVWEPDRNGVLQPRQGLHPLSHLLPVGQPADGDEAVSVLVEAASNPVLVNHLPNPNSDLLTADSVHQYWFAAAELVVLNSEVIEYREDLRALKGLLAELPTDQPRYHQILSALEASLDELQLTDVVATAPAARAALAGVFAQPAVASAHRIFAIGHAHIDTAWLWPVRETVRKCSRTFANVLRLMEEDEEFKFGCSQAVQYEWIRDRYPSMFEEIRTRVAEGRWIPLGGMWVEADTNLAGGEALIRQFVFGQRFFESEFGVRSTEGWLPDVFGYSGAFPQILRLAGIDQFLTQKLSWNKTNRFPHHTFLWEGIDGSTVFTHFPPAETYNGTMAARELAHAVRNFADKGGSNSSVLPFGHGDGGGGPTPQMLAQFHRVRNLEGSPRVEIESPAAFFRHARQEYSDAPRWVGELYFEMHRGTFTSQAKTKAGNRMCEQALRETEMWASLATRTSSDFEYPHERLDQCWKQVLLHQFHDILPGSSIGWVHREAEAAYAQVLAELAEIAEEALGFCAGGRSVNRWSNPNTFAASGVLAVDGPAAEEFLTHWTGARQLRSDGVHLVAGAIGPLRIDALDPVELAPVVEFNDRVLDNGILRCQLDESGTVTSILDQRCGRELLPPGSRANVLQLQEDFPNEYDAWDVEDFAARSAIDLLNPTSIELLDAGPLVGRIAVVHEFGNSKVRQILELAAGSDRLDVHIEADWHEHEQMLKVAFPVDLHALNMTREIQFGRLESAIHTNTSWDQARFEVSAHRWVAVDEPDYTVALVNSNRFGYQVTRDADWDANTSVTLRLSLLRGPRYPDPEADQGVHHLSYSFLARPTSLLAAHCEADAAEIQSPPRLRQMPVGPAPASADMATASADAAARPAHSVCFEIDSPGIAVAAVKRADDRSGDLILRLYEATGVRTSATLRLPGAARVRRVDVFEQDLDVSECPSLEDGQLVSLQFRPFEVQTIRLTELN